MEHYYRTFISVGNAKQHFLRLLNGIESVIDILPHPILIQSGHTPFVSSVCKVIDFIAMDKFEQYVNHAEILILHAGAGSFLHAMKAHKLPIIVPRKMQFNEIVNDHQVNFARMLQAEGKALMVDEVCDLRSAVAAIKEKRIRQSDEAYSSKACGIIQNLLVDFFDE